MERGRVVVFGASGWTGRVLVERLEHRGHDVLLPGHGAVDLGDPEAVIRFLDRARPQAVVNVAAAPPGASAADLSAVNVGGAEAVARGARGVGARLVHVSSDAGLDGRHAPYGDDAPMAPLTPYGRSKAEGEARVLAACPGAVAVRTSLLWDPEALDRSTAGFARRLAAGEACRLFTDEIRCPLPRRDLARSLVDLLGFPYAGTLNVAGREAISRHAFGLALHRHFDVPGTWRVEAVRAADLEAAGAAPRPRDLRLDVSRAEALFVRRFPGVKDVLASRS